MVVQIAVEFHEVSVPPSMLPALYRYHGLGDGSVPLDRSIPSILGMTTPHIGSHVSGEDVTSFGPVNETVKILLSRMRPSKKERYVRST